MRLSHPTLKITVLKGLFTRTMKNLPRDMQRPAYTGLPDGLFSSQKSQFG
jgi:hypothetical protein